MVIIMSISIIRSLIYKSIDVYKFTFNLPNAAEQAFKNENVINDEKNNAITAHLRTRNSANSLTGTIGRLSVIVPSGNSGFIIIIIIIIIIQNL